MYVISSKELGGLARVKRTRLRVPHRVFCQKSLDLLDSKGDDFFRNDKEFVRVSE
jgi:hypothetical protein